MAEIRRCHAEVEAVAGQELDLPEVTDPAILAYYVVEKDGQIIGGLYLEKSIRQCHFGLSFEATKELQDHQADILASSKEAGVRFVHCSVYKDIPTTEKISQHLDKAGYQPRPDLLDHMFDLRT